MIEQYPNEEYIQKWIIKVKDKPWMLEDCPLQTEEICIAAVGVKGYSYILKYVKEQTPAICLAAINNYAYSLLDVKEPTFELVWVAYKRNPLILQHVKPEFKKMIERKLKIDRLLDNE